MRSTTSPDVYSATRQGTTITVTPSTNAWFTGNVTDASEGGGMVSGVFDVDDANIVRGFRSLGFFRFSYTDSLFIELYGPTTQGAAPSGGTLITSNRGIGSNDPIDLGSNSRLDPFLEHDFTAPGTYILRVGSHREFDVVNPFFPNTDGGVARGIGYGLNISLQRHATNSDAIELVGKQITITDGTGQGQTAQILAYDAKTKTYTVDQAWGTAVGADSQFEIEFHLEDEFSGYEPVGDTYSIVLSSAPTGTNTVTIDVLPQITRTLNSDLTFVPEANYGESAAAQVNVATPRADRRVGWQPGGWDRPGR